MKRLLITSLFVLYGCSSTDKTIDISSDTPQLKTVSAALTEQEARIKAQEDRNKALQSYWGDTQIIVLPRSYWQIIFLDGIETAIAGYNERVSDLPHYPQADIEQVKSTRVFLSITEFVTKQETEIRASVCNGWTIAFDGTNPIKHNPVNQDLRSTPTIKLCGVSTYLDSMIWGSLLRSHRYDLSEEGNEISFFNSDGKKLVQFQKRDEVTQ